jgi:hypothetical protein
MQAPCSPHVHCPCCVTTLRCALLTTTGLAKKDDVYAYANVTQIGTARPHNSVDGIALGDDAGAGAGAAFLQSSAAAARS